MGTMSSADWLAHHARVRPAKVAVHDRAPRNTVGKVLERVLLEPH